MRHAKSDEKFPFHALVPYPLQDRVVQDFGPEVVFGHGDE